MSSHLSFVILICPGFAKVETPQVYATVNKGLENGYKFANRVIGREIWLGMGRGSKLLGDCLAFDTCSVSAHGLLNKGETWSGLSDPRLTDIYANAIRRLRNIMQGS
ncbi:MAG: hypothetical protein LBU32_19235 [Clostridiales bacterium]|nr:hypothetical protein [Clostridiales bacterium]